MLQWACASVGAILVTVNPAYRLQELVRSLRHNTLNSFKDTKLELGRRLEACWSSTPLCSAPHEDIHIRPHAGRSIPRNKRGKARGNTDS